ncbi:hypothetical protein PRIPAC_97091 [Pristionchus pacificus]|uniref:RING-type domain-containing protein n=1 Tax=Pristionchus pacificus TaxID=54126 RepID=A0A2A6B2W3_PRIPA|nr:hypothetical protein PRIPAC_97091 [Pristionchus pacificus]|eukprot:PDM60214.1 hypothetical protein PRIPAC_54039 [Pristionchus pacificus]
MSDEDRAAEENMKKENEESSEGKKDADKDQLASNQDDGMEQGSSAQPDDPSANECAFCLDNMASDDEVIPQGCPHVSHKKCLLRWLKTSRACQNCRAPITKLKMKKSGKNVALPKLDEPKPGDFHYVEPPLPNDEEFLNAPITTSEDEEDEDFELDDNDGRRRGRRRIPTEFEPILVIQNPRYGGGYGMPRRRRLPDRSRGSPSPRDDMISSMADFISGRVGSTRSRGRGGARVQSVASPAPRGRASRRRRHDGTVVDHYVLEDSDDDEDVDVEAVEEDEPSMRQGDTATRRSARPRAVPWTARQTSSSSRRRPIQGGRWELVCDESEEEEAQSASAQDSDNDEETTNRRAQRRQQSRGRRNDRFAIVSSESEEEDVHEDVVGDEDEEEEATESSEDSNTGTEEGEGDSMEEDSELDESVLEDQPSSSRQMAPIVRKTRGAKKKGTKKKRKTTKKTTKKRKTTKRKKTKRVSKKKGRKQTTAEDASELRRRIDATRLSLNGAGIEPLTDDNEPPVKRRASLPNPTPSAAPADPTDLLGSILSEQVVAHAPGRYLEQRDGRLVPGERFGRHLDRLHRRGVPVDGVDAAHQSSSSASSAPPAPVRSTAKVTLAEDGPRLVPLSTGPRLPPPPPSSSGLSSRLRDAKIKTPSPPGDESASSRPPLILSSAIAGTSRQRDTPVISLSRGSDGVFRPSSNYSNGGGSASTENGTSGSRQGTTSGSTHGTTTASSSRPGVTSDSKHDTASGSRKDHRPEEDRKKHSSKSHRSSGSSSHGVSSSSHHVPSLSSSSFSYGSSASSYGLPAIYAQTQAQIIERQNRERFATLRRLSNEVTNEEVAAGRITACEQQGITTRVSLHMLRMLVIEEEKAGLFRDTSPYVLWLSTHN